MSSMGTGQAPDGVSTTAGVVVVGAGGHAKVCIELLRAMGLNVAFCIGGDDSEDDCLGVPVKKGDHHLTSLRSAGYHTAFIAVGANGLRERLAVKVRAEGFRLISAISPAATVSPTAVIGEGVAIMAGAVINAQSRIGDLAIINTCASIDHDGVIGQAAHVAPHGALAGNVQVGDRAFLGIGTKVIPGVSIGADVTAGAGSVVIRNIEAGSRIVGVPARPLNQETQ